MFGLNQPRTIDLSSPTVVSLYDLRDISHYDEYDALVRILTDTATAVVWHAYYAIPGSNYPGTGQPHRIAPIITYVKARQPWVMFEGAIDAYDYCPNSGKPDLDVVYTTGGSYPVGFQGCWPIDPAKPKAQQLLIGSAESLIDAGCELLHFDLIDGVPAFYGRPQGPYIEAWRQIASAVKDYARTKYSIQVLVTINTSIGQEYIWPYQDYLTLGIAGAEGGQMVRTQNFQINWAGIKNQIKTVYGSPPPLMLFLDWGAPKVVTPMVAFGALSKVDQILTLTRLNSIARQNGANLVFPLHGANIGFMATGNEERVPYDATALGTYDAIRQLSNTISTVHTMTVTSVSTLVSTTVVTLNVTSTGVGEAAGVYVPIAIVSGAVIIAVALTLAMRRRDKSRQRIRPE